MKSGRNHIISKNVVVSTLMLLSTVWVWHIHRYLPLLSEHEAKQEEKIKTSDKNDCCEIGNRTRFSRNHSIKMFYDKCTSKV